MTMKNPVKKTQRFMENASGRTSLKRHMVVFIGYMGDEI